MNMQKNEKAVREYKTIKRRELKSKILNLKQNNEELFKTWAFEKSLDDKFLRKIARENYIEIEKLENAYEKVAAEVPTPEEINWFLHSLHRRRI